MILKIILIQVASSRECEFKVLRDEDRQLILERCMSVVRRMLYGDQRS